MFENIDLSNFGSIIKQARDFQSNMSDMQKNMESAKAMGSACGGMVELEINGLTQFTSCRIDPVFFNRGDAELLEETIIAAANDALAKIKLKLSDSMKELAHNPNFGDIKEMIEKLI